ncbi:MAG: hypothetical protein KKF27_20295, partial [Gammaproteobacteria bacterium]|nr:hypothetical protein [Gammaproteobacteria bacterium]
DTKLSDLTELAATPAVDDEIYIRDVSEAAAAESKRITTANLLAAAISKVSSGTYAGNNTVNRAVAHGLSSTPNFIIIQDITAGEFWHRVSGTKLYTLQMAGTLGNTNYTVTAIDGTNFYVGNASDYTQSANLTGKTYAFIAIG